MSTLLTVATVVEAIADVVIAILLVAAAWYLFDVLRRARVLTERVQHEGEEILEEIEEARADPHESSLAKGAGLAAEVVADLVANAGKKKRRKKS